MSLEHDTRTLLDDIERYWRRFLAATDEQITALCAWTLHTYIYDAFNTTPYLIVTSAEMRSGKSTVLEILDVLARKAFYTTGVTEAVLFRMIAQDSPTLLLDEQDRALREHHGQLSERQEMIVGVINLGYRKKGRVFRMTPSMEVAAFPTFCPKALAGIGHLPHTIEDRGLPIRMVRMSDALVLEEFDEDLVGDEGLAIAKRCEDWAYGARLRLSGQLPEMPEALDRRAKQAYRVLVGIGDLAGDTWGPRIRGDLVTLRVSSSESPKESQGLRLLRDVQQFAERLSRMMRIETRDLLTWLYEHGEQPWDDWWGEASSKKAARRLALALGEYGIKPERWKEDGESKRGYDTAAILAVMRLYASDTTPLDPSLYSSQNGEPPTRRREASGVVLEVPANPHESWDASSGVVLDSEGRSVDLGTARMDDIRRLFEDEA